MVNKELIFGAIIFLFLGGVAAWFHNWHYKTIETLERENKALERTVNNLSVQLQVMMQENKVKGFEEYFKGYKDENISNISNDFIF